MESDTTISNEKIMELLYQIKNSPVMNGKFDKLVESVDELGKNMAIVMIKQEANAEKITETHEALYHPDNGVYRRINDVVTKDKHKGKDIRELEEKTEELEEMVEQHEEKLQDIHATQQSLKKVAGERMEHLDSTIQMQKNTKKLFWTSIVAAVGVAAKACWELLV